MEGRIPGFGGGCGWSRTGREGGEEPRTEAGARCAVADCANARGWIDIRRVPPIVARRYVAF
jgi:hypothetical protein